MSLSAQQRSKPVAVWLFAVAALVALMVVVGGATRLTESGLSITEWRPVTGAIPPLNAQDWAREFDLYRDSPQYQLMNRGMSMAEFQVIYWWEWAHRLLGRVIGLAFALPFFWFLFRKEIPQRLVWRCWLLLGLGGLQGAIGWWMVASGLVNRVNVAPERLTVHLGVAFVIFLLLIWTALEAWSGPERARPPKGWVRAASVLLGLTFFQSLLGALVAGNRAGRVFTDFPLMDGRVLPPVDWTSWGPVGAFLHDPGLVQFNHRLGALAVVTAVSVYAARMMLVRSPSDARVGALAILGAVWLQAAVGVATLMNATPIWLGVLHQLGALVVLTAALVHLWTLRRTEDRLFSPGIVSRGL